MEQEEYKLARTLIIQRGGSPIKKSGNEKHPRTQSAFAKNRSKLSTRPRAPTRRASK